jgi:hypothetical protein
MKLWKRWKRTLQLIFNPTTRQIAAAIRLGKRIERKNQQIIYKEKLVYVEKPHVIVEIDPAMRQRGYEQSAWNSPPERTTGPVQGIRRRATMRTFQEHPGTLMQHERAMQQKKALTRQLDSETVQLPTVPQPRKPHFYRLMAEPDSTFNAL